MSTSSGHRGDTRIREWRRLPFRKPDEVLRALRKLETQLADVDLEPRVRTLRTAGLKRAREARDAALFALGMSHRLATSVHVAPVEAADYDFVTAFELEGVLHFVPVQLKELVPAELNPHTSMADLLAKLRQMPRNSGTALAVRLNRRVRIEFPPQAFEGIPYDEMWLFWAASPDAQDWRLYGDVLKQPQMTEFQYPT